ncbi:MAG: PepSY-associated TM helix domain-containing protein [Opitutales bacterium]|nr:PepSY-associated TM helix domain-containing protein [Opitutales bacterium]
MSFRWRKWFRIIHRDLGYFIAGLVLVYSLSGIALNHLDDWNPSYIITKETVVIESSGEFPKRLKREDVMQLLADAGVNARYKSHYHSGDTEVRLFLKEGNGTMDLGKGTFEVEWIRRRPIFYTANKIHYNPGKLWTWFSDFFAVGLIVVTLSGLFLLRGKHGITRRGGLLVLLGIVIPAVFVYFSF